jgi:hypothetical protein
MGEVATFRSLHILIVHLTALVILVEHSNPLLFCFVLCF